MNLGELITKKQKDRFVIIYTFLLGISIMVWIYSIDFFYRNDLNL
jgi:hypothetical protein